MDLVILEKIEYSILNALGYTVPLEKKNGNDRSKYAPAIKDLKNTGVERF